MVADRDEAIERLIQTNDEGTDPTDERADEAEVGDGEHEPAAEAVEHEHEGDDEHDDEHEHDDDAPTIEEEDLPSALDALSAYFADVGNGRLLTFDEELALGRAVQT